MIKVSRNWTEHCVCQRGETAKKFINEFLGNAERRLLLVAGAGFDPRSTIIASRLAEASDRIKAVFVREIRDAPSTGCAKRALSNETELKRVIPDSTVVDLHIFAEDGAVVGGRRAAALGDELDIAEVTDLIIDFSALSKGVSFPLTRLLLNKIEENYPSINLHVMVVDEVVTDTEIVDASSDKVGPLHGFQGGFSTAKTNGAAILWLPQLTMRQQEALNRIHRYVAPHEVCPVLPFPCSNPRAGDELAEQYLAEFQSIWHVDPRDVVYASEGDPLDFYRTVIRLDAERRHVFEGVGGSITVLSPVGSKVTSIGALMAAIDQDFPVVHVEALSYEVDFDMIEDRRADVGEIVHVWLHGESYAGIKS